jgi:hypothetical protein
MIRPKEEKHMKSQTLAIVAAMLVLAALVIISGDGVVAQGPESQGGNGALPTAQPVGGNQPSQNVLGPQAPVGGGGPGMVSSSFSYQGQLKSSNAPVNGNCDFAFSLWDQSGSGSPPSGGVQVGLTLTQTSVLVTNGLFNVVLDFSNAYQDPAFHGDARWLQIAVRCPAGSAQAYTILSPRQPLWATPYALGLRPGTNIIGNLPNWNAIYASNVATTSYSYGIRSQTDSPWGRGLSGESYYTGGMGVYGYSVPGGGAGVAGYIGNDNLDVYTLGSGQYGVYGKSQPSNGIGVYGEASGSAGTGVYGYTSNDITTTATYGVIGKTESGAGFGGYFWANNNTGRDIGVYGRADGDGISGNNASWGVIGHHYYNGVGVGAWSYTGNIIEGYSGDFPSTASRQMYLDHNGNLYINGVYGVFAATSQGASGAEYRALTAIQSSEAWYEDFGTATLVSGKIVVTIEPVFAKTVDTSVDYHVYVTPLCSEAVLLFVSDKTAQGFTVQGVTLDGKASQCAFDYRIVAKPVGQENTRLPTVAGPVKANDPVPVSHPTKSEPAQP